MQLFFYGCSGWYHMILIMMKVCVPRGARLGALGAISQPNGSTVEDDAQEIHQLFKKKTLKGKSGGKREEQDGHDI